MRAGTVDNRIDRLARAQHGVVDLSQTKQSGVTADEVRSRIGAGSLVRLQAGVYRTMGARETWEQALLAACLAAGPTAVASHRAAALLWDLVDPPVPVEIVVPYEQCPTPVGTILHRSTDLRDIDRAQRHGVPATNPMRTVGDLGAVAPHLVKPAVERGLYLNLFTTAGLWRLVDDLARPGRRGLGALRRALAQRTLGDDRARSPLEPIFADIAADTGLHVVYQYQVTIAGHRYVLDFALPPVKVAVEVDGLDTHATRAALDHDNARQNHLILDGWVLLRYTATHLRQRRSAIRRELTQLVEGRRASL